MRRHHRTGRQAFFPTRDATGAPARRHSSTRWADACDDRTIARARTTRRARTKRWATRTPRGRTRTRTRTTRRRRRAVKVRGKIARFVRLIIDCRVDASCVGEFDETDEGARARTHRRSVLDLPGRGHRGQRGARATTRDDARDSIAKIGFSHTNVTFWAKISFARDPAFLVACV